VIRLRWGRIFASGKGCVSPAPHRLAYQPWQITSPNAWLSFSFSR